MEIIGLAVARPDGPVSCTTTLCLYGQCMLDICVAAEGEGGGAGNLRCWSGFRI